MIKIYFLINTFKNRQFWYEDITVQETIMSDPLENVLYQLKQVRSTLYQKEIGSHFPFAYVEEENDHVFKVQSKMNDDLPTLFLCSGKVSDSIKRCPEIVLRLDKKTSQGKIYVAIVKYMDQKSKESDAMVVVKTDHIENYRKNQWFSIHPRDYLKGLYGAHPVISSSYMDALCSVLLSSLVENKICVHFPICYAANVSNVRLKRARGNKKLEGGSLHQVIWMEYLQENLNNVLKKEKNVAVWKTCIIQVAFGLLFGHVHFKFIHGDLHCNNLRVRMVEKSKILHYRIGKRYFKVPTNGIEIVFIDFGRAAVALSESSELLVSSEYHTNGSMNGIIPDSRYSDLARFALSMVNSTEVIENEKDRKEIDDLFAFICHAPKIDLVKTVKKMIAMMQQNPEAKINLCNHTDGIPRSECKNSLPEKVIQQLSKDFEIFKKPEGVTLYELDFEI